MALAPLNRIVILTEDGSVIRPTVMVTIPPRNVALPSPPIIASPAAINSDGSPQVGETLTGVDPTGNGPIVARRWIVGGATVATAQTYAPTATGSLRYEADLQGPDGTIATSGSTITVQATITLAPLALSSTLTAGTASSGTITGATAGSTITDTAPGLTIDSAARTYTWDGTGAAGPYSLTETLTGATNSPRTTAITVQAAPVVSNVTIDPNYQRSGQDYTFTARRTGDPSAALTRTIQFGGSTDYPPGSLAADWPNGFPSVTVTFPAGSPTVTFTITVPATVQPE